MSLHAAADESWTDETYDSTEAETEEEDGKKRSLIGSSSSSSSSQCGHCLFNQISTTVITSFLCHMHYPRGLRFEYILLIIQAFGVVFDFMFSRDLLNNFYLPSIS